MITIDLHGQHVKQAMRLLKLHLLFGAYVRCKHLVHLNMAYIYTLLCFCFDSSYHLNLHHLDWDLVICSSIFFMCCSCPVFQSHHWMWEPWSGQVEAKTVGMGLNIPTYFVQFFSVSFEQFADFLSFERVNG